MFKGSYTTPKLKALREVRAFNYVLVLSGFPLISIQNVNLEILGGKEYGFF